MMAVEAFDRFINNIGVNLRYFKAQLKHTAAVCDIMTKSKEISYDIERRIVNLHNSGSSVQTIIGQYKQHGNVQPSYRSGERWVLCPRDEYIL